MKVAIVLLALVAYAYASGECSGCRRVESLARSTNSQYSAPIAYPCRFDCKQIVTSNNNQPLFASCSNSIISYGGDYFGAQQTPGFNINFQCLTPSTYQNFLTSRSKLAYVLDTCQNQQHGCRKTGGQTFTTTAGSNKAYAGIPALSTLALRTTSLYYQWYSLYASMRVVNNVVRCPTNFRPGRSRGRGNSCNCDLVNFPELFSGASPKMPTATSDGYKSSSDVPSPVNPYSSYVQGFLGNYSSINPFPNVAGDRDSLLSQARLVLPVVSHPVHLGCIDDSVDITSACDD
jgi:hypothetical protein